jgi:hypothetical protein
LLLFQWHGQRNVNCEPAADVRVDVFNADQQYIETLIGHGTSFGLLELLGYVEPVSVLEVREFLKPLAIQVQPI